jgi:hypothetical protein
MRIVSLRRPSTNRDSSIRTKVVRLLALLFLLQVPSLESNLRPVYIRRILTIRRTPYLLLQQVQHTSPRCPVQLLPYTHRVQLVVPHRHNLIPPHTTR